MPTSTLLVKRNMSPERLQNLEDFSKEVGFLLSLQQTPVLVATKTARGSRPVWDEGICEPISEMNCVTVLSKLSPLTFPSRSWMVLGRRSKLSRKTLAVQCGTPLGLLIFINHSTHTAVFSAIATTQKPTKTIVSNTQNLPP